MGGCKDGRHSSLNSGADRGLDVPEILGAGSGDQRITLRGAPSHCGVPPNTAGCPLALRGVPSHCGVPPQSAGFSLDCQGVPLHRGGVSPYTAGRCPLTLRGASLHCGEVLP